MSSKTQTKANAALPARRPSLPRGSVVEDIDGRHKIVFARQGRDHLMLTDPVAGRISYVQRDTVKPVLDSAGKQIRLKLDDWS